MRMKFKHSQRLEVDTIKIKKEIEQHYLSLSEAEKKDNWEWCQLAAQSAKTFWE